MLRNRAAAGLRILILGACCLAAATAGGSAAGSPPESAASSELQSGLPPPPFPPDQPLPAPPLGPPPTTTATPAPPPPPPSRPAGELPAGLDLASLDRSVAPCDDFFRFACDGWIASHPIPADQPMWSHFGELDLHNRERLRTILESAARPDAARTSEQQKIGDYYASCMDEEAIDAAGLRPLQPDLDRIAALRSVVELPAAVARLHRIGADVLFRFSSRQDLEHAGEVVALVDEGGMALPDRDYYLKDDAASVTLRGQYREHVQRIFELAGDAPGAAASEAADVLAFETALARGALDLVSRRDPKRLDHRLSRQQLAALTPAFDWNAYLGSTGSPAFESLQVYEPDFLKALNAVLAASSVEQLRTYLRWQLLHASAPLLPRAWEEENFAFFDKALGGAREIEPRWRRCEAATGADLGEALGRVYVEQAFSAQARERILELVEGLERALASDITTASWMVEETKRQALLKLRAVRNKIGFPAVWRDYGALQVVRGDALGNSQRANEFELARQLAKIGKPLDREEWLMAPQEVNAYYSVQRNEVVFPAGILQPPFFDAGRDDAANYGAIGSVIGHELTHGFDDAGRQFAADGDLRDWWAKQDAAAFEKRAACIADQFSGFTAIGDVKVNGRLTLGEDVADAGGLRIAYQAYRSSRLVHPAKTLDGFTPEQRFFIAFAQNFCAATTPELERLMAQTDTHAPDRFRVNGSLADDAEFAQAFACKAGAPMVRQPACRVW
jgi:putative endopeptidase